MGTHESKEIEATKFELPDIRHADLIVAAILHTALTVEDAKVVVSRDRQSMFLEVKRLAGFTGDYTWPLVSHGLLSIIHSRKNGGAVKVELSQQIHREENDEATILHSYEIEYADDELTTFGHGVEVLPKISEKVSPETPSRIAYIQSALGATLIDQDLGENQELRAGDCDMLFDQITAFWP